MVIRQMDQHEPHGIDVVNNCLHSILTLCGRLSDHQMFLRVFDLNGWLSSGPYYPALL